MPIYDSACAESPVSGRNSYILGAFLAAIALTAHPGTAATNRSVVVQNDRGGAVVERANLIQQYKASGIRIEIRGEYCLSSCTMFLSLPDTCVTPDTIFGFHGPSSRIYGIALSPASFDHWSEVMANHYPEPLKSWFLRKGRHRIVGFYEYSGAELINMGIRRCTSQQPKTG